MRIDATELLVGGEVGAGSDVDTVTIGKGEDHGDEANSLLAKKEPDGITIRIIRNGVIWEGETKVHGLVIGCFIAADSISIVMIRCMITVSGIFHCKVGGWEEVALLVEAVTEIIVCGREMVRFMIPVVVDEGGSSHGRGHW